MTYPGTLNPALTKDDLFVEHESCPNNNLIADVLYQAKYIEKFGTGFTDLVDGCRKAGLPDPKVEVTHAGFTISIKRAGNGNSALIDSRQEMGPKSGPKSVQERILVALDENELSSGELAVAIGQHSLSGKLKLGIKAMLSEGLIAYTIPDRPRSRLQKYRLTEKGKAILAGARQ